MTRRRRRRRTVAASATSVAVAVLSLGLLLCLPAARGADDGHAHDAGAHDAPAPPPPAAAPVPVAEAAARMTLPEGFKATLFAGEPDVVQPIAFTIDDRGRLWVCEGMSYPKWQEADTEPQDRHDRILILEDADNDGRFDKRTVFADKLVNLSGIEVGFGGVYVCSTPSLLFFPDADADDRPDGEPKVLLNGFTHEVSHNVFNGLSWGPDGWLYGLHGILAQSRVGSPDLPADSPDRVPLDCGVWRIHPVTHAFEVVATGTTNPFGLDFDERGQMFITNCVLAHLWHVIPGAHFQRMYGRDPTPGIARNDAEQVDLMRSCADHLHWGGGSWTESRGGAGKHSEAGGGHAHVGAMIYLGDNWPDAYRGALFTHNLHGTRVNVDRLEPAGSGYVARHAPDFLFANDAWFRGLELAYGPDGGVYMTDWSDTDECHDYEDIHRENGRIFKITYGDVKRRDAVDLAKLHDVQLIELLSDPNEWFRRKAQRLLHERAAAGKILSGAARRIETAQRTLTPRRRPIHELRLIWALHVIGGLDEPKRVELLSAENEYVRAWSIRLEVEDKAASPEMLKRFAELAASDPSPVVRVHLASALQRLPLEQRWEIAERLAAHAEDASDANLPLMVWYAIEPLVFADPARAIKLLQTAKLPVVRENIARRLTEGK
jgi:putative membrane-bound dehydrogenase-like protein